MLVLSRFREESIVLTIDGKIVAEIKIIDIRGDKVRLGFTAERKVQIHRKEFLEGKESQCQEEKGLSGERLPLEQDGGSSSTNSMPRSGESPVEKKKPHSP